MNCVPFWRTFFIIYFFIMNGNIELSQEPELSLDEINAENRAAREDMCKSMIYAVIDTNVLVSALITHIDDCLVMIGSYAGLSS